jgi:hypothetical protein
MRYPLGAPVVAGALIFAIEALAESPGPTSAAPVVHTNSAPAAPVTPSKRFACRAAAQNFQGQERIDQLQLCVAQARLDCLKQAIDQRIVGPERRDFVQTCVGE